MDDEIHAGPLIRKAHSFRTHAFSSAALRPASAIVAEDRVRFALRRARRLPQLAYGGGAPVVPILEAGPALSGKSRGAWRRAPSTASCSACRARAMSRRTPRPTSGALAERIPVVFASRTGAGETLRATYAYPGGEIDLIARGLIPAQSLDARKARIALQLLLSDRGRHCPRPQIFRPLVLNRCASGEHRRPGSRRVRPSPRAARRARSCARSSKLR